MDAGALNRRLDFEAPNPSSDTGAGNYVDGHVLQFTQAAAVTYLKGGEGVLASRLAATQPVIITIRRSTQSQQITPEWRVVDKRGGVDEFGQARVVYQVKEWPRHPVDKAGREDRSMLEMLAVRGVNA